MEDVQAPAVESSAPQPMAPTPEQLNSIKMAVLDNYSRFFNDFMKRVEGYPAHQHLRQLAFSHFEGATAIMEKAIANMPVEGLQIVTPQPQASGEPAQSQEETQAPAAIETPLAPDAQ